MALGNFYKKGDLEQVPNLATTQSNPAYPSVKMTLEVGKEGQQQQ